MSELLMLFIAVIIFAVLARFTDRSVFVLCCFIKGAALILISNWVLEILNLDVISLNLFTAPTAGLLGVPAIGLFWLISAVF